MTITDCDHGRGELSGHEYWRQVVYTRPWRRFFRKTYWRVCFGCDIRERV